MPFIRADKTLSEDDLRFLSECVWPLDNGVFPPLKRPRSKTARINGIKVRYCECGTQISEPKRCCEPCLRARRQESYKRYYASHREQRLDYVREKRRAA